MTCYQTVKLEFLANKVDVDVAEVRSLLAELILEERIQGKIDQVQGILELQSSELQTTQKHSAVRKWADILVSVNTKLFQKVNFDFGGTGNRMMHHGMDEDEYMAF